MALDTIPGAKESNAGDRFHILWACRRCLEMVNPKTELTAVVIEGVAEDDADGGTELFLAADITEYYGKKISTQASIASADRVVVSQIKFSTRHPQKAWTASRLCAKQGKKRPHSVISRLAETFKGFSGKSDRRHLLESLKLCLVSNQPIAVDLRNALHAIQQRLDSDNLNAKQSARFIESVLTSKKEQAEIQKLKSASRLSGADFIDFLRMLNFSKCGELDRFQQYFRLRSELGDLIDGDVDQQLLKLYEQIANQALPGAIKLELRHEDVLASLGIRHPDNLFPSPARLSLPQKIVTTSAPSDLAKVIEQSRSRMVLAHGVAGVGKTTVIQQLAAKLPTGSNVFVYDCFGDDSFRKLQDERHSDHRALKQIANEMATRLGSHLMVWPADRIADLRRGFNRRLQQASKLQEGQGGLLVLVIDAADNSVIAAMESGEPCFVYGMWELDIPENVRLVMTARSGGVRAGRLKAPSTVDEFEIPSFNEESSTQHLRFFVSDATDDQAEKFHSRTLGNARLQFYLLEQVRAGKSLAEALKGPRQNLDDLFKDRWVAAQHELPETNRSKLAYLSCVSSPIELSILEVIWAEPRATVERIANALQPGMKRDGDFLSYRDEDFAVFAHEQLSHDKRADAHAEIAKALAPIRDSSPYAAGEIAKHYHLGNCHGDLIALALSDPLSTCIDDEVVRLNVAQDRLNRALQSANKIGRRGDVVRLLLLSGELDRTQNAVYEIVSKKPELAISYGDPVTVAKTYLDDESDENFGAAQFRCAAMLSRNSAHRTRAIEHAKIGAAWVRKWMRSPKEERPASAITSELIASEAEVAFRLKGPQAAYDYISRWEPLSAVMPAYWKLAKAISREIKSDAQYKIWKEQRIHPQIAGIFLVEFWRAGNPPTRKLATAIAKSIERYIRINGRKYIPEDHHYGWSDEQLYVNVLTIDLCEALAAIGVRKSLIKNLIQLLQIDMPGYPPDDHFGLEKIDASLRSVALDAGLSRQQLDAISLLPRRLREEPKDAKQKYDQERERETYISALSRSLPVIVWRANCLIRHPKIDAESNTLSELIAKYSGPRYGSIPDMHFRAWAIWAIEGILFCSGKDEDVVNAVIKQVEKKLSGAAPAVLKSISKKLVADDRYWQRGINVLLDACKLTTSVPLPSSEKWEFLTDSAEIASVRKPSVAKDLFQQAVFAAQGLDNSCGEIAIFLIELAKQAVGVTDEKIKAKIAARICRVTQCLEPFTSDPNPPLPKEEALEIATLLHPETGAAVLIDWDAQGILSLRNGVVEFTRAAMQRDILTPCQGLALGRLIGERQSPTRHFINVLERAVAGTPNVSTPNLSKLSHVIADWVSRDCPLSERGKAARILYQWFEKASLMNLAGVERLRALADFATRLDEKRMAEEKDKRVSYHELKSDKPNAQIDLAEMLSTVPQPLFQNLNAAFVKLTEDTSGLSRPWAQFFESIRENVFGPERIEYLNQLIRLPIQRWDIAVLISELANCLGNWRDDQFVNRWQKKGVKEFFERHLQALLGYTYERTKHINSIRKLFPTDKNDLWELLIDAIVLNLSNLGTSQAYLLAGEISALLSNEDRLELLDWSLTRIEQELERENALSDLRHSKSLASDEILPHLVWTLLGHPDKRERWRVMHAVRLLEREFDEPVVEKLINLDETKTDAAFTAQGTFFFCMSARLFLVVLLGRLVGEKPAAVIRCREYLLRCATDLELPHALIRDSAALALLELEGAIAFDPKDSVSEAMESIIRPNLKLPSKTIQRQLGDEPRWDSQRQDKRFDFSMLDTLPYWFQPLAGVFGISTTAICQRAEKWICDKWGQSQKNLNAAETKTDRRRAYHLYSNDHGSIPTIETPHMYFTYHAWQTVAGELVDEHKIFNKPSKIEDDSWRSWLTYKRLHSDYWTADIRQPTPLEPTLFGLLPTREEWLKLENNDFDRAFSLQSDEWGDWLPVRASVSITGTNLRGNIQINSALVSTKTSRALMRALQHIKDPSGYKFPDAGEEDFEIRETSFELKGYLIDSMAPGDSDDDDPLRRKMDRHVTRPASVLGNALGMKPDALKIKYNSQGKPITRFEAWSDDPDEERIYSFFSEGRRFYIRVDGLLEFLRRLDYSLIVEVQIRRREERSYESGRTEYEPAKHQIYLIHKNGEVETGDRRYSIGKAN